MATPHRPDRSQDAMVQLPMPPKWFDEDRAELYYSLGKQVGAMKILERSDMTAFCILIDNLVIYNQSAETVILEGSTTDGREGTTVRHPAIIMKNTSWSIISPLLVQFGLTPSARRAMGVGTETESTMSGLLPTNNKD